MAIDANIGIIGGAGWLGSAIARSAVRQGVLDPARLTLSGRSGSQTPENLAGARWTRDNQELADRSDVIILSVRPAQFPDVKIDARGKLVISVMAGVSLQTLAEKTGAAEIVRTMPNAAAAIGQSFTPWYAAPAVSAENRQLVRTLFDACGEAAQVTSEEHLIYCGGLTGAGAAFPALLAEALIAHAVRQGLPRDFAQRAAKGVVAGASQLCRGEEADTAQIVREMIDYRGTTAAALEAMISHGFMDAVAAGLEAASAKAAILAAQA